MKNLQFYLLFSIKLGACYKPQASFSAQKSLRRFSYLECKEKKTLSKTTLVKSQRKMGRFLLNLSSFSFSFLLLLLSSSSFSPSTSLSSHATLSISLSLPLAQMELKTNPLSHSSLLQALTIVINLELTLIYLTNLVLGHDYSQTY